jgi:hypothetical protein
MVVILWLYVYEHIADSINVKLGSKSHAVAAAAAAATAIHISISPKSERSEVQYPCSFWLKHALDKTACLWRPRKVKPSATAHCIHIEQHNRGSPQVIRWDTSSLRGLDQLVQYPIEQQDSEQWLKDCTLALKTITV